MAKLILNDIGSFSQTAITTINQNQAATETAMENTLSRDGTAPNQMTADFDMNGNDILNVEKATIQTLSSGSSDVDVQDIIDTLQGVVDVEAMVVAAEQAAADAEAALVQVDAIYDDLQPLRDGIDGGTTGQFLTKASNTDYDYNWATLSSSGDMLKSTYDPTNINASAFARANHTGTQLANTISNFSTSVQTEITTTLGPSTSPQFAAVNIGHATDTTVARGAAGFLAVEGNRIPSPASQASGDILYRGATEWERLAIGTAGQALVVNAGATSPEWGSGGGISKVYVSAEQTLVAGGAFTLTHGLGAVPKIVVTKLVCKTAEVGYAVGDQIEWGPDFDSTWLSGILIVKSATQIKGRFGSTQISHADFTTGNHTALTPANFRLVVEAYA